MRAVLTLVASSSSRCSSSPSLSIAACRGSPSICPAPYLSNTHETAPFYNPYTECLWTATLFPLYRHCTAAAAEKGMLFIGSSLQLVVSS